MGKVRGPKNCAPASATSAAALARGTRQVCHTRAKRIFALPISAPLRPRWYDAAGDLTEDGTVHVIMDLCVVPLGVGVSVSRYVAACERVLRDAGLNPQLHAYGTNIEGEWDAVMAAVKRCHEAVHQMGAPRVNTTIKLGTRTDRKQSMAEKVRSVEEKMT